MAFKQMAENAKPRDRYCNKVQLVAIFKAIATTIIMLTLINFMKDWDDLIILF